MESNQGSSEIYFSDGDRLNALLQILPLPCSEADKIVKALKVDYVGQLIMPKKCLINAKEQDYKINLQFIYSDGDTIEVDVCLMPSVVPL